MDKHNGVPIKGNQYGMCGMNKTNAKTMKKQLTNKEIIRQAQAKIIARAENNQDYTEEQHLKDIDLIYELTLLSMKYK